MPKQDTSQGKQFASLLKRLAKTYNPDDPPPRDPTLQLVVGFLEWEATRKQAEQALERLMAEMVDVNDLRVSFEQEVLDLLGSDYPLAEQRVARMRETLNEIYIREHATEMRSVAEKGKKEQRAYLDTLPGMVPYVAAQTTLLAFGGHAMPVDHKLIERLAEEGIIDAETTDPQYVENVLLRLVRADEALNAYLLLQAWADERFTRRRAAKKGTTQKKKVARRSASASKSQRKTTTRRSSSAQRSASSRRRKK